MTTSTDPSSSEQSCDTVIYVGPRDEEGTDAESPPVFLPALNAGDQRAVMSRYCGINTIRTIPYITPVQVIRFAHIVLLFYRNVPGFNKNKLPDEYDKNIIQHTMEVYDYSHSYIKT